MYGVAIPSDGNHYKEEKEKQRGTSEISFGHLTSYPSHYNLSHNKISSGTRCPMKRIVGSMKKNFPTNNCRKNIHRF